MIEGFAFLLKKILLYRIIRWIKRLVFSFLIISVLITILLKFISIPITPLMVIRWFEGYKPVYYQWVPIEEISSKAIKCAITSEDQRFLSHFGFDIIEINQSIMKKIKGGKLRGASTISQQTAKNVFLWPGRSWLRKGLEIYFTFLIEVIWGKARIMEVYLNIAEMGKGIYGMEAASNSYFKKSAKQLNLDESASIIACLPNPLKFHPIYKSKKIVWKTNLIKRNTTRLPYKMYGSLIH